MNVAVSILVIAAILAIGWAPIEMARRVLRWAASSSPADARRHESVLPFGPLSPLEPIGQLGGISPDADIDSDGTDEHNLYGD